MRLARVKIKNFRCYAEEVTIDFDSFTSLIGRNDIGKSAILEAIGIFFEEIKPDADDASRFGDRSDMQITCEFADLPRRIVIDASSTTSLEDEYLLNPDGRLEITRIYNGALKTPSAKTYINAVHPMADGLEDLLSLKISDLKKRASDMRVSLEGTNRSVSAEVRAAIRDHVGDLLLEERLVEVDVGAGAKQIFEKIKEMMPSYFLYRSDRASTDQDSEAQDPLKVAVKLAIEQQKEALADIASRVKNEVTDLLNQTVSKIAQMSPTLAAQLSPNISEPKWDSIFKIALTTEEEIPLNKRGSGVRRLVLLALLQAQAESRKILRPGTSIIYAIEEPETGLHPDSQRALLQALQEIAEQIGYQVIITTHSPMLGRLLPENTLRYITSGEGVRLVLPPSDDTMRLVARALGVLPDHRVKVFVGVEGKHDESFLKKLSTVLCTADPTIANLDLLESEGKLIFIPVGGANAGLWVSRLQELDRPEFHIFDRDHEPPALPHYAPEADKINARPNCAAVHTSKREIESYLHPTAIRATRPEADLPTFGDFESVPMLAAQKIHEASESENSWEELDLDSRKSKAGRAKTWLNNESVLFMTPELLKESDPTDEIIGWLRRITEIANSA